MKKIIGLLCMSVAFVACQNNSAIKVNTSSNDQPLTLDSVQAKHLLSLPLHCPISWDRYSVVMVI